MRYEVIHEIFNLCPGNQMRDVFVSVEDIANPEEYVRKKLTGEFENFEVSTRTNGDVVIDVTVDSLRQRFSFSQD